MFVKKLALCGVSVAMLLVFSTSAEAQRPLERFRQRLRDNLPKGELIKRIRDRIEKNETDRKRAEAAKKAAEAKKRADKKRVAESRRGSQPTPADPSSRLIEEESEDKGPQPLSAKEAKKYEKYGFRIGQQPKGLLAEAGVRKGDRVLGVGGMPVESMKEVDEVLQLLKPGDRIEVVVNRRGKKYQLLASNGKPDANTLDTAPEAPRRLSKINNDFAPPVLERTGSLPAPKGMSSVLENQTPKRIPNKFVPPRFNKSEQNTRSVDANAKDAEIQRLREQLKQMKKQLDRKETGSGVLNGPDNS